MARNARPAGDVGTVKDMKNRKSEEEDEDAVSLAPLTYRQAVRDLLKVPPPPGKPKRKGGPGRPPKKPKGTD